MTLCSCGQLGCLDKTISGPGLARLYEAMTGRAGTATEIVADALTGDLVAKEVLEQFFVTIAKAFVTIIHCYDPDIIIISGGLNQLPGLYERVPELLRHYTIVKNLRLKIVPAMHGAMSGLCGAALLVR
jgi:predicted NBD/HSP70 family sugar kinase